MKKKSIYIGSRNMLLAAAALLAIGILCITAVMAVRAADRIHMQKHIAGELIRFHVRANSNTCEDQTLKLKVRDAVIDYLEPLLADSGSVEQSKRIIAGNTGNIITVAQHVISDNGMNYTVNAYFTTEHFPTRKYGAVTLPAGVYDAYRIDIGNAEGYNWWCVLYPPLCFEDETHAVMSGDAQEYLKSELTPEEYELITNGNGQRGVSQAHDGGNSSSSSDGSHEVIVRFRLLKFLNRYME